MAYGGFKDLKRITAFDKILRDKAFNIAKNPKYHGYQRGLSSMVYKFFDKKAKGGSIDNNNNNIIIIIIMGLNKIDVLWTWLCYNWLKNY